MADRRISQLVEATTITSTDLFVTEQDAQTKKVTGQTFINSLATALSGRGGIQSIEKTGESGLVDTYTITFANQTTTTFEVTNGAVGATGTSAYLHIKYSTNEPVRDSDMHDWADRWLGTAATNSQTAPTSYSAYKWYDTKGAKGDTGEAGASATLLSSAINYADSESGDVPPSTGWSTEIPTVQEGHFLWTRTTIEFSVGDPIIFYSVGKIGVSGSGSGTVTSVGLQNATDGGLAISGSPIQSSGVITIGHSNPTITPQTAQGVYPIKIDAKGHITAYGSAATAASVGAIPNPNSKTQGQVLTWDGSSWVAQNPSGSVESVNGYTGAVVLKANDVGATHPNLLDNPWFTINQRGVTTYSVSAYGVDRWKLVSGSASVTANGITLNGTLRQIRENALGTSDFTASVKMYSGSATASYNDSTKYFDIVSSGGTIRAAKLEIGSTSTIAFDSAPNYSAELLKCQRYFMRKTVEGNGFITSGGNNRYFVFDLPTEMRTTPSVSLSGKIIVRGVSGYDNGFPLAGGTPTSLTITLLKGGTCHVGFVQATSNLQNNTPISFGYNTDTNPIIELTADL